MPNPAPPTLFPNMSVNAQNELVFNTSNHANPTFTDLSNAEADENTGDVRKLAHAILKRIEERFPTISPAPVRMGASDSVRDGGFPAHIRTIRLSFVMETSGTEEVMPE